VGGPELRAGAGWGWYETLPPPRLASLADPPPQAGEG
jgi:hypothetical protein